MSLLILPAKSQAEDIPVTFNFLDQLVFGETITGAVVTVVVYSGIDPTPNNMLADVPVISTPLVTVPIQDGIVGVIYTIVCTVTGSGGHVYTQEGRLAVITPGGLFSNH